MALAEGLRDQAVLLQTFIGLGMAAGTLCFGLLVVSRSKQCLISRQYLLQTSIFGIGFSILALSSLENAASPEHLPVPITSLTAQNTPHTSSARPSAR